MLDPTNPTEAEAEAEAYILRRSYVEWWLAEYATPEILAQFEAVMIERLDEETIRDLRLVQSVREVF